MWIQLSMVSFKLNGYMCVRICVFVVWRGDNIKYLKSGMEIKLVLFPRIHVQNTRTSTSQFL